MTKPQINVTVKGRNAFTAYYANVNGINYAKPPLYEVIEIVGKRYRKKYLGECRSKEEFIQQIELHQSSLNPGTLCQNP
ncbi:hypothetical protein [Flavobacterium sp. HSC-61S13]|uniref:hypothetical protein n=1 Tax=Flavobacterium sp. HSC-61S13 TaxID=2910963 RepID=UPI0020A1B194|nr:hypothetical protein [Flavobacterium sp. HSC-61S13]MCP1996623.1 hypothetical protein [Flavobacterium sp. HSC-61S13]